MQHISRSWEEKRTGSFNKVSVGWENKLQNGRDARAAMSSGITLSLVRREQMGKGEGFGPSTADTAQCCSNRLRLGFLSPVSYCLGSRHVAFLADPI